MNTVVGLGLAGYFAGQEWGTEIGWAVGLGTLVVLSTIELRVVAARIRRRNPPGS
jgi:hypothetical protein